MKTLADLVGVSAASMSQYENYVHEPSEATVEKIAELLAFPIEFFYGRELNLVPAKAISFRSRRSMTAKLGDMASAYLSIAIDVISPAIRARFRLPDAQIPDLSKESPEQAAIALRTEWKLGQGPIANMVHLLESKGVEVFWINEESPSVSAFSRWSDKRAYVFLNSHSPSGERGRFDAAHELGHLVLHNSEGVDLDGREAEAQADAFAAAFLMPADQFRSESPRIPLLKHYFPLKARWRASIAAMVRRSRDTGVISQWQYECACREISTNGWRMREPHQVAREESAVHQFVFAKLEEKDIAPEDFARDLGLSLRYLETLMPLATQYHEKRVFGEDLYSLSLLQSIDKSLKSNNLGLGID